MCFLSQICAVFNRRCVPFLTATAANAAAITAAGVAALTVTQLLPRDYLRHLSLDTLRVLQAVAHTPTGAGRVDLSTLDAQGLLAAFQQGQADIDAVRAEIGNRVVGGCAEHGRAS